MTVSAPALPFRWTNRISVIAITTFILINIIDRPVMAGLAHEMPMVDKLPQSKSLHYLIEVIFSCQNLPNMDENSQSDAFIKVETTDNQGNRKKFRTETIMNNNSPSFIDRFRIEYAFEKEQKICLKIMESDNNNQNEDNRKYRVIDQTEFFLSQLVTTNELSIPLPKYRGSTIKMQYLEVSSNPEDILNLQISGANIKGLSGRSLVSWTSGKTSNPYLEFWRATDRDNLVPVYRTEAMMNNCYPIWNPIQMNMQQFCNRDEESEITIKCIHYSVKNNDRVIGVVRVTPKELVSGTIHALILKGGEKGDEPVGQLNIVHGDITRHPLNSFLDYIREGCEINLMVAIDFTASNGRATEKDSLHYVDPQNPYRVDCDGNPTGGSPNQVRFSIGYCISAYDRFSINKRSQKLAESLQNMMPIN
uniref:C2 domain-containing protein n=1 Tax=Spongospora subterranea TaxID=70186 RepID=A0A0H5QU72_9EUKA|eukprot:CRZ05558.1 hypothetical protein [Spongospora subterranea]